MLLKPNTQLHDFGTPCLLLEEFRSLDHVGSLACDARCLLFPSRLAYDNTNVSPRERAERLAFSVAFLFDKLLTLLAVARFLAIWRAVFCCFTKRASDSICVGIFPYSTVPLTRKWTSGSALVSSCATNTKSIAIS